MSEPPRSVPGQVTIRWDTVTYSGQNPCEHSCTLYPDGRMRFNYGPGNMPITPTIGISAGDGVNYLLSSYNNSSNLNNADSTDQEPVSPLPDGMVLSTSGVLSGTPTVTGTFNPQIKVSDSLGRSDVQQFFLDILDEAPCAGDVNGDDVVNVDDLLAVLDDWGICGGCPADIDGDGDVDVNDLLVVVGEWGACP